MAAADDPYGILGLDAGGPDLSSLAELGGPDLSGFGGSAGKSVGGGPGGDEAAAMRAGDGRLARPGDICAGCRSTLIVSGMEYACPSCHEVFEAADIRDVISTSSPENPGAGAIRGRLRVVGREAAFYQPDVDRTNPVESREQQKKATYAELLRLNKEYEGRGGNPFPLNVLQDVATYYNVVQQDGVKRSQMKRGIIAALLSRVCIARGFVRTRSEVTEFAKLNNHGIARGDDYLRSIDEDKGLGIDMNESRLRPHIKTVFALLDLDEDAFVPLQDAVAAIVEVADANYIGICSVMRSKVIAATAEVLRRKPGMAVSAADVASKCKIRIHTIRRVFEALASHHSFFEGVYEAHGLESSPHKG